VFEMTTNAAVTPLVFFGATNGANPAGGLMQASDGNFYGTTLAGGAYGFGTIFKMTTNAALTTLFSFDGTNGSSPEGTLVQGADGNLYGTTEYGGVGFNGTYGGNGTIFCYPLAAAPGLFAITSMTLRPNGTVQMLLTGPPGNVMCVLASTNLPNWETIATLTNFAGTMQFTDPAATNFGCRFYQLVMP
jgi:uncharacterized repeat protein (TIGR03803 family)